MTFTHPFPTNKDSLPIVPAEEGWMTDIEVAVLTGYAAILPQSMGGLLEVGCYRGRTSSALGRLGGLTVVDTFQPDPDMPEAMRGGYLREFRVNMAARDLRPDIHVGNSHDILPKLVPRSFRLILVDASHKRADVFQDLSDSWRLLAPGGYLFVDDADWPSVAGGMDDFARDNGTTPKPRPPVSITGKLVFIKKVG